jgi:predicted GNAT superfamily acetyltransferase
MNQRSPVPLPAPPSVRETGPLLEIRQCTSLSEFSECVRIEHATWGEDIAVPAAVFVVAHQTGGYVLGAFESTPAVSLGTFDTNRMVGFTLAFSGVHRGTPFLHSHMTAVLKTHQNRGVGRRLKLFQRQEALKRGIGMVQWTFDPLELKNAHFNLTRLGAVVRSYIPNCYGITESPLHAGLPTDRLLAEWHLDSERVKSILTGPPAALISGNRKSVRISLPGNIGEIKSKDSAAGAEIQSRAREEFEKWFAEGYVATDVETQGDVTRYILHPASDIPGLSLGSSDETLHEDGKK